jgi:hypothetical protein
MVEEATDEDEIEFESCVRYDSAIYQFDPSFALWMCAQNMIYDSYLDVAWFCAGNEI